MMARHFTPATAPAMMEMVTTDAQDYRLPEIQRPNGPSVSGRHGAGRGVLYGLAAMGVPIPALH